jgi:hypothetical protein
MQTCSRGDSWIKTFKQGDNFVMARSAMQNIIGLGSYFFLTITHFGLEKTKFKEKLHLWKKEERLFSHSKKCVKKLVFFFLDQIVFIYKLLCCTTSHFWRSSFVGFRSKDSLSKKSHLRMATLLQPAARAKIEYIQRKRLPRNNIHFGENCDDKVQRLNKELQSFQFPVADLKLGKYFLL